MGRCWVIAPYDLRYNTGVYRIVVFEERMDFVSDRQWTAEEVRVLIKGLKNGKFVRRDFRTYAHRYGLQDYL